ncbi:MAG: DUF2511 domain-containing protein [Symbiopectobacterium sp.]
MQYPLNAGRTGTNENGQINGRLTDVIWMDAWDPPTGAGQRRKIYRPFIERGEQHCTAE